MSEYFYGKPIMRKREQHYIECLLSKFRTEPPTEELKKKIWEELQKEKFLGNITIPFKIALRKDPTGKFPTYIEVILDTKV